MDDLDDDIEVSEQIGKGCWSVVLQGLQKSTGLPLAIKVESGGRQTSSLLLREAKILKHLQGIDGVPGLIKYGSRGEFNFIAMQRLRYTLDELRKQGQLKPHDVLRRAVKLLETMEQIHKRGIIHQDLQPRNLMADDDSDKTYYIDFGLAKSISIQANKGPRNVGILGTPSFSSLSALLGVEQDCKDDLEAIGYNLVWLIAGKLPWEEHVIDGNLNNIKLAKFRTPLSVVCQGCPDELVNYLTYVRGLQFRDNPDYQFLKHLLENSANKLQSRQPKQLTFAVSPQPRMRFRSEDVTGFQRRSTIGTAYMGMRSITPIEESACGKVEKKKSLVCKRKLSEVQFNSQLHAPLVEIFQASITSLGGCRPAISNWDEHKVDSPELPISRKATRVLETSEYGKIRKEKKSRRKMSTNSRKKSMGEEGLSRAKTIKLSFHSLHKRIDSQNSTASNSPGKEKSPANLDRRETMKATAPTLMPETRMRIEELKAPKPSNCCLY